MTNTNDIDDLLSLLIERLRAKVAALKACIDRKHEVLDATIRQLRKVEAERDEARRELCAAKRELCRNEAIIRLQRHRVHRDSEDVVGLAKEIAVERGWDCFKENTNGS